MPDELREVPLVLGVEEDGEEAVGVGLTTVRCLQWRTAARCTAPWATEVEEEEVRELLCLANLLIKERK